MWILILYIGHVRLLYIGMSHRSLPSQWVANPGNSELQDEDTVTICVCVCLHVCVCSVAQLCPTLWGPMDCNLPSSCAHRIFQARILGWSAISYSRDLPNLGSNRRLLWPLKEKHQIYHSIWLNNSFSCFLTSSYLCWWERTELQVYFEGHFTWRKLISTNYWRSFYMKKVN